MEKFKDSPETGSGAWGFLGGEPVTLVGDVYEDSDWGCQMVPCVQGHVHVLIAKPSDLTFPTMIGED